ncbi:thermonuclease family protein [Bacillus sp. CGMCC 1.16607]|uniref:thermonuclease family protein n=1 Tax=Bacillus sp. CGMCC 1.16607 TaxID=3351842 RepID=UPI00364532AC
MKKQFYISTLVVMLLVAFIPIQSIAHPGAKDELGGHFKRADCTYLLHEPTTLAKSAKSIQELIDLIKKNNSNNQCAENLSPNTIDLEGFTFPKSNATTPKVTTAKPAAKSIPTTGKLQLGKQYVATLDKCTDGDTANFKVNGKIYKTRFLYIDTPESTTQIEPFGKEASQYTCNFLKKGKKIVLETDGKSLYDKYNRLLAWVFVDNKLHQEEITKAGLVEGFYDYGNYKYEKRVVTAMSLAKKNKKGMYTKK